MKENLFLRFVPELAPLLADESISEVQCNGPDRVFVERNAVTTKEDVRLSPHGLRTACELLAQNYNGQELGADNPIVDTRLPDGSRVAICVPPVSVDGITLTIRKHQRRYFSLDGLTDAGMLDRRVAGLLSDSVIAGENILVSGATGSGKTTLADALAHCIPLRERIIIIEDTTEIELPHANQRRFEAQPTMSIQRILKASLRHSPKRIILGEIRGAEAYDLMQLLNTGHNGSICTVHASSARLALRRFRSCVMQAGIDIPYRAIGSEIADSINVVIHLELKDGRRLATEAVRVTGYDPDVDRWSFEDLCGMKST
jgi:pilus assembly protein CpaF